MPDSILLSTHLHPFPGRYGGTRARPRLYFERIHDARRPGEAKSKRAPSREVIFERALRVEEPRTIVDGFHFHTQAAISAVVEPSHQQMAAAAAIFQNVASEFGGHGCNHRHLGGSKRLPQPLVELNVDHGRMQPAITQLSPSHSMVRTSFCKPTNSSRSITSHPRTPRLQRPGARQFRRPYRRRLTGWQYPRCPPA